MKNELINLCTELESHFDQSLTNYDDRLARLEKGISERINHLQAKYPEDNDVTELAQLGIGLRRTRRFLHAKLDAIQSDGDDLLHQLDSEIKEKLPKIRQSIEDSDTYEQAVLEIQRESHSGTPGLKDFFQGLLMWRETPEERIASQRTNKKN